MLVAGLALIFQALGDNTQFFENPSEVVAVDFVPKSETFKIGGLVVTGSVTTQGLLTEFQIDDFERPMRLPLKVTYTGKLPDLFEEGQGVVVTGQLANPTLFVATKLLAKHDENYQPVIKYDE